MWCEGVADTRGERSGIAFFPVRARVTQRHSHPAVALKRLARPHDLVETAVPAVQAVGPVVAGEVEPPAAERELPVGDAIRVAADDGAEVGGGDDIAGEAVEAK